MAYRQDLFVFMLQQLRAGKTAEDLSADLNQLVQDCRNVGKKGELVLKITIEPDKGDTGQYFIDAQHKVAAPKFAKGKTMFWGTPEGNLQRQDPSQGELPLRVIPDLTPETKFVDSTPQTVKQL